MKPQAILDPKFFGLVFGAAILNASIKPSNLLDNSYKTPMNEDKFYITHLPIKLTEARQLKLSEESWGLLTEYYLESVKITNFRSKTVTSATIRVSDRSGQVTCVIKGLSVGQLFGLTPKQWLEVESMCDKDQQLFYRYFKNGVNKNAGYEQKLFYNLCLLGQKQDVLLARFRRCTNTRNKFREDALLEVIELRKCDSTQLDLYINKLRTI